MNAARRRFEVVAPDWGQAHLTSDAIVAFVDDELAAGAHERAARHLQACPECAAEVVAQAQARAALRSAAGPMLPSSLLSALRSIPQDTDLPAPPPGLAMSADGQLVSVLRPQAARPQRQPPVAPPQARATSTRQRRLRFGAGAAVSGLALGALALAFPALAPDATPTPDAADRGVLGGALLGGTSGHVLDARLHLPAASRAATPAAHDALLARLDRMPATFESPGRP
jgi:hypothetical protein